MTVMPKILCALCLVLSGLLEVNATGVSFITTDDQKGILKIARGGRLFATPELDWEPEGTSIAKGYELTLATIKEIIASGDHKHLIALTGAGNGGTLGFGITGFLVKLKTELKEHNRKNPKNTKITIKIVALPAYSERERTHLETFLGMLGTMKALEDDDVIIQVFLFNSEIGVVDTNTLTADAKKQLDDIAYLDKEFQKRFPDGMTAAELKEELMDVKVFSMGTGAIGKESSTEANKYFIQPPIALNKAIEDGFTARKEKPKGSNITPIVTYFNDTVPEWFKELAKDQKLVSEKNVFMSVWNKEEVVNLKAQGFNIWILNFTQWNKKTDSHNYVLAAALEYVTKKENPDANYILAGEHIRAANGKHPEAPAFSLND